MKRFSFRLDRILGYRKHLEKKAQRDLFNARNEYMRRERVVKGLARKRREIARQCSDEGSKGIDVPQYQIYRSFLQKLKHDLQEAYVSLRKGEEQLKAKEVLLKKESIKKKTLETLKDMQLDEYMKKLEREEQKALDELVIVRRKERP